MSYDEHDAARDEFLNELYNRLGPEWAEENSGLLYEKLSPAIIEDFQQERLASYYHGNRDVALSAFAALEYAKGLVATHPKAAFVFALVSAEVTIKHVLLRPLVSGLVHNEGMASLVMMTVPNQVGNDAFKRLFLDVLDKVLGVTLVHHKRRGSNDFLWAEWVRLVRERSPVVHDGRDPTQESITLSLQVAEEFLIDIVPRVLKRLELKLSNDKQIVPLGFIPARRNLLKLDES